MVYFYYVVNFISAVLTAVIGRNKDQVFRLTNVARE